MSYKPITLRVKNGIVSYSCCDKVVGAGLVDKIAQANGFVYAEQFVQKYAGLDVTLDENMKVIPYSGLYI